VSNRDKAKGVRRTSDLYTIITGSINTQHYRNDYVELNTVIKWDNFHYRTISTFNFALPPEFLE